MRKLVAAAVVLALGLTACGSAGEDVKPTKATAPAWVPKVCSGHSIEVELVDGLDYDTIYDIAKAIEARANRENGTSVDKPVQSVKTNSSKSIVCVELHQGIGAVEASIVIEHINATRFVKAVRTNV